MQKWFRTLALPILALALVAAACSDDGGDSGDGGSASASGAEECTSDIRVGVALDVGGLGDKSFNDAAEDRPRQGDRRGLVCEANTKFLEANSDGHEPRREHGLARRRRLRPRDRRRVRVLRRASTRSRADYPDTYFADHRRVRDLRHGVRARRRWRRDRTSPTSRSRSRRVRSWWAWRPRLRRGTNCDTVGFLGGQSGPADREVRGRLHGRGAGVDPDMSARRVHRRQHDGVRRRTSGRGPVDEDVRRRRRDHLPRRRRVRGRAVHGRRRQRTSSRSASTPTST